MICDSDGDDEEIGMTTVTELFHYFGKKFQRWLLLQRSSAEHSEGHPVLMPLLKGHSLY